MGCLTISEITNIILALATGGLAIAAFKGLNRWREQIKERDLYKISYKTLTCSREIRDMFKEVRLPSVPSYESDESAKIPREEKFLFTRWKRFHEERNRKLRARAYLIKLRLEVLLPDEEKIFHKLITKILEYENALEVMKIAGTDDASLRPWKKIILGGPQDDFSKEIEGILIDLSKALQKHIT